ncbi:hypothetical protein [uncultured Gimesia sp.]|uniref:hypothetical protein n=1 Tax=uncultured Gimesia sp. TaxID=1678688 RepID=UPI0030D81D1E|tara:strand:+ start:97722 stop:98165 length:444 start_codon:yes stop_codon:yes gene_type:complete
MARRLRSRKTVCIAAILLFTGIVFCGYRQRQLSPLEARLVGEWAHDVRGINRIFHSDHRFSTATGDFKGTWFIDDHRLTIEYWEPLRFQGVSSVGSFLGQLRRIDKTDSVTWEIEFSEDGQTKTLIFPEKHSHHPGKKWEWMRWTNK